MASDPSQDKISMVSIGGELKAARERKGVTLDQAQKQTRIYAGVLSALENGRGDEILTEVYVRGFLKKYSEYLGLDANVIVKEYDLLHSRPRAQMPDKAAPEVRPLKLEQRPALKLHNADDPGMFIRIKPVLVIGVVLVIIFFAGKGIVGLMKASSARKPPAVVNLKKTGSSKKQVVKKAAVNVPLTAAVQEQASVNNEAPVEAYSDAKYETPKNLPIKLEMKIKRSVMVKLKVDGSLRFGTVLYGGTKKMVSANKSINLYIAKAEFVELTLNGNPLTIKEKGIIKDLEITKKGVKIR